MYDLIIIGSGPAGLTSAIYAGRAMLKTLVLEASYASGGQIVGTYEVDNYPGLPLCSGMELAEKFREHAGRLGAEFITAKVTGIELKDGGKIKVVHTKKSDYQAKAVIIATGAAHRSLGVPGENEFSGMGVSYCATCDGAFFKGSEVAVCGGGDVALEDALYLARICEKVHLIHRRQEFRGAEILQAQVREAQNILIHTPYIITEIRGAEAVSSVIIEKKEPGSPAISGSPAPAGIPASAADTDLIEIPVKGCFIAVGMTPNTRFLAGLLACDESGYIIAAEDTATSVPGIFAAGDVRAKRLRQVVTAVADGALAVTSAQEYLRR